MLLKAPEECSRRYFLIVPSEIHFLRFIIEAYEGIGVVSTIDPGLGLVQIAVAPGCEQEVSAILESEKDSLRPREVPAGSPLVQVWEEGMPACRPRPDAPA
jgi:hypothetical protein